MDVSRAWRTFDDVSEASCGPFFSSSGPNIQMIDDSIYLFLMAINNV